MDQVFSTTFLRLLRGPETIAAGPFAGAAARFRFHERRVVFRIALHTKIDLTSLQIGF